MSKFTLHLLTGTTAQAVVVGNEVDVAQTDITTLQGRMTSVETSLSGDPEPEINTPITFTWDSSSNVPGATITALLSKKGRKVTLFMPTYFATAVQSSSAGFHGIEAIPTSLWPDHAYALGGLIAMPIITRDQNGYFRVGNAIIDGAGELQIEKAPERTAGDYWLIGDLCGWLSFSMFWYCVAS